MIDIFDDWKNIDFNIFLFTFGMRTTNDKIHIKSEKITQTRKYFAKLGEE
jgi:hypothetical protein